MYTSYVFIALALIAVIVVWRTATVVPQESAYVVENLGKYSRTLQAGFHVECFSDGGSLSAIGLLIRQFDGQVPVMERV